MCSFILSCIRFQLQIGWSSLLCWGAVQGSRARGLRSFSIEDSCFKACGISVIPPGIELMLPELEGWPLFPRPPGTFQALSFLSTTTICSSPLYDLGNPLICIRGWSITEDVGWALCVCTDSWESLSVAGLIWDFFFLIYWSRQTPTLGTPLLFRLWCPHQGMQV